LPTWPRRRRLLIDTDLLIDVERAPGAALVTYEVTARRPGDERPCRGQLTSVFRAPDGDGGGWRLAFHQQTRLP
jgi:hypothetical protein